MRTVSRAALVAAVACSAVASPPLHGDERAAGLTGGIQYHGVTAGETLRAIGARVGVEAATLALDNGISATGPLRAGQVLRIDNRHLVPRAAGPGVLVVNVPQRLLFFHADGATAALPVAVGRPDWRTPLLPFTVITREVDPSWDVPASIREEARRAGRSLPAVVPPGPDNPLGRFWIGLDIPSVGIHGTTAPSSIYRAVTHGCIRLGPADIAWLFAQVEVGTPGRIIYEPILLAAVGDEVFLEVHGDVYRRLRGEPGDIVRTMAGDAGLTDRIDWEEAAAVVAARHGVARPVGARKGQRRPFSGPGVPPG